MTQIVMRSRRRKEGRRLSLEPEVKSVAMLCGRKTVSFRNRLPILSLPYLELRQVF